MANIPNPLGNLGTAQAVLPDMTAGVQALQRTEIQRRLEDIEQDKKWQREDNLRNEAFALKMATTDVVKDARVGIANRAMEDIEEFRKKNTDMWRRAGEERRSLSLPEKMELIQEQQKILQNNAQAASFADALEKAQGTHMTMLKSLKDPETRSQYEKQWADLYQKMQDPEVSSKLSSADVIDAIQPPPPSVNAIMGEWDTQLIPKIDSAVSIDPNTGAKRFNRAAAMETVKASLKSDPYGVDRVKEKFGYTTDQQVYDHVIDRVKTSVGITGGRAGDDVDKDKTGFVVEENAQSVTGESGAAIVPQKKLTFDIVSRSKGEQKGQVGKFNVVQFMNLDGEPYVVGERKVKANIVEVVDAQKKNALEWQDVNIKNVRDLKDGNFEVTYAIDQTISEEVPYSTLKGRIEKYYPEMEQRILSLPPVKSNVRRGRSSISFPEMPKGAEAPSKLTSTFTINGESYTKEELKSVGWSDEDLKQIAQ